MANPRPLSVVKIKDSFLNDVRVESFGLTTRDRFLYHGEIAQDTTRCIITGLFCGKKVPYLLAEMFEEVDPTDF
jgi:hypothetical protein